jgi:hypothetical protein
VSRKEQELSLISPPFLPYNLIYYHKSGGFSMDNGTKISKEQIENMKTELESVKKENGDINTFLQKYLDREQGERVKRVLSDPQKIKEILSSPLAKSFMEKYESKE